MPAAGASTDTLLRIGDSFPKLQAVDLDGNAVTLDTQLLGDRYTLIVFWSTWCEFCMLELPHEIELAKRYERFGLRVIGINADETSAIAKAAATEHDIPWLNLFEGPDFSISNQLGIKQWPALLLLDSDGKVVITTPELRSISVETSPDGTDRQIDGLEWALQKLLEDK
jgi:thiol-disulfide isomerase/thioredoxin